MLFYQGEWKNGKKDGSGKLYFPDGQVAYEGQFVSNQREGNGKEFRKSGTVYYEGSWQKGKKNGPGTLFNSNGQKAFSGVFVKGKRYGQGKEYRKTEACIMPENGEKKSNTDRVRYTTRKNSWFIRVNFETENVMVKENNTVKMEPSIMTDSGETIRNTVKALFLPKMVNKFSQEISGKEGELISEPK